MRLKPLVLLSVAILSGAAAPAANSYNDRLRKLAELQRLAAMRRAILDSGERCGRVSQARFQGPYGNLMMWTARCINVADYAVFVGNEGSVQVRQCAQARTLKLPPCAKLD